jgi:hypothetical protein
MASRSIVRVGISIIDLHEPKGQIDIVGDLWPRCDGCAVAVAPAVWRNWAAIRLALGRIYSDFRDYPEMVRLLSDKLPTDEIFIYQAMGDDGRPTGGALCYLLQQYISPALVALS